VSIDWGMEIFLAGFVVLVGCLGRTAFGSASRCSSHDGCWQRVMGGAGECGVGLLVIVEVEEVVEGFVLLVV